MVSKSFITSQFKPAWWLPGAHLQTLWQPLVRKIPQVKSWRERLETPDGDFLDIDWSGPQGGPVIILLHGLTGSSSSTYIRGIQVALEKYGWCSASLNFRGCSGQPNRTALGYHSGETSDFDHVYRTVSARYPECPVAAIGYSLGGNVLLKWLGEEGGSVNLLAAVAVCAPLRLDVCATRLDSGFSRLYRNQLLGELKDYITTKRRYLAREGLSDEATKLDLLGDLSLIRSFWEYDNRVVAPLYGFDSALSYYQQCSSRQFLRHIECPTLVIHARNDPFMTSAVLPDASELSPSVRIEVTSDGGHVGFVSGKWPWSPEYWLESRIPEFLIQQLTAASC